jgi:UDP-N-acetylglucosamine--N-acetylmuramyl-(pentapeptide) pyrophosphoryl-undecaprenol N-acetylglucosamine transferase
VKVLICGGGTGGHIYPALAAVASLQETGFTAEQFLWIGTEDEIEETLLPRAGIPLETVRGGAIAGVSWRVRMKNTAKLTWSLGKSLRILDEFRPGVLLMTGGYVSVPVALAAWMRRVPAVIYLPDIEPGMAIRRLSRLAKRVACTSGASQVFFPPGKSVVTGYPVRPELREATKMSPEDALARFDLQGDRQTLLVFGGSRGARSINRALMDALPGLLERFQVIHISGKLDWDEVEEFKHKLASDLRTFYRPYPYLHDEMGAAFRAAELVLARAGASMLGECPAFALPAVLVPYPYAWRYQKVNADYLVGHGAGVLIEDEKLSEMLLMTVSRLMQDEERLMAMSEAAKALDRPDSAANLAGLLLEVGQRINT